MWELKITDTTSTKDHQIIAENFNNFFSEKIINLQAKIDKNLIEDPVGRLRNEMASKMHP